MFPLIYYVNILQGLLAGSTLALETLTKDIRHYAAVGAFLFWTSIISLMAPIAYVLRNCSWQYLQMAYALCSAWSIIQWWYLRFLTNIYSPKLDNAISTRK